MNIAFDRDGNRYEAKTTADWANADLVISVKNGAVKLEKVDLLALLVGMDKVLGE